MTICKCPISSQTIKYRYKFKLNQKKNLPKMLTLLKHRYQEGNIKLKEPTKKRTITDTKRTTITGICEGELVSPAIFLLVLLLLLYMYVCSSSHFKNFCKKNSSSCSSFLSMSSSSSLWSSSSLSTLSFLKLAT